MSKKLLAVAGSGGPCHAERIRTDHEDELVGGGGLDDLAGPRRLRRFRESRWFPEGRSFGSNGERIYFTASNASGQAITYQGGPSGSATAAGGMSGQLACATCHGSEGHGGRVTLMMQTFDAPNITWPAIRGQDASMDHPPYTAETLKRAITAGVDPAGQPLKAPMPRWSMSPADLNDLEGYLQTLR